MPSRTYEPDFLDQLFAQLPEYDVLTLICPLDEHLRGNVWVSRARLVVRAGQPAVLTAHRAVPNRVLERAKFPLFTLRAMARELDAELTASVSQLVA